MKPKDGTKCPNCGNDDLVQISTHSDNGVNEYICKKCDCRFGN
jgi:predicted RNA-binding Zn-ribbon protein involved in translation (DUF1610 family)